MSALIERSLSLYEHLDLMDIAAASEEAPEAEVALQETIRREIAHATAGKVENIHRLLVSLDMMDSAIDTEVKRLKDHKDSNGRIRERIRNNVLYAMQTHEIKKISGKTVNFSLRAKPASVVIDDESKIPTKFKTATAAMPAELWADLFQFVVATSMELAGRLVEAVKAKEPVFTTSKSEVKKAIEAGEEIPGADLSFGGQSLVVR